MSAEEPGTLHRKKGCSVPVVAYGHYPMGVFEHAETQSWHAPERYGVPGLPSTFHLGSLRQVLHQMPDPLTHMEIWYSLGIHQSAKRLLPCH